MGDTFCFSKDLKIILYGVNAISRRIYGSLEKAGYHVVAFFDKRYEELKDQCPIPVYELSDNPYIDSEKDHFCVIILLQNAMQHMQVAAAFLEQGYHKILFSPMGSRLSRDMEMMYRIQNNILQLEQFGELTQIPVFRRELFQERISINHSVIREEGNYLTVWCPAELLYSGREKLPSPQADCANIPVMSLAPYLQMFRYLQGDKAECMPYLDRFRSCFPSQYTDADILAQRKRLLEIYRAELNYGMDFFISSAPVAKWNEDLRVFNLTDGHHRCSFLLMQGFRYVPIRVSATDFGIWNLSAPVTPLDDFLNEPEESLSILHPKYKRVNESADQNQLLQIESIQNYLFMDRDTWFENQTILDASDTYGYFARNALRMRASKAVSFVYGKENTVRMIDSLEGFPHISIFNDWDAVAKETYHTLFILNALADRPLHEKEQWINKYADLCQRECFVIMQEVAEVELWKQRFSEIRGIRNLFDRGELMRLYVLKK